MEETKSKQQALKIGPEKTSQGVEEGSRLRYNKEGM
jgi:hypothetical protein